MEGNTNSTMFDFFLFYNRVASLMPNPCTLVEVGVANGVSALYLADKLNERGRDFKLYLVDNLDYGGILQLKQIYENIIKSGLGHRIEVIPTNSFKASKMFNDNSIDFVYLDSSHQYKETKQSIRAWYPKLKDDSLFGGHDYYLYKEVKKAVDELLPQMIKRETIDNKQTSHYQEFQPEQFLITEPTPQNYGLWYVRKKFYYSIK